MKRKQKTPAVKNILYISAAQLAQNLMLAVTADWEGVKMICAGDWQTAAAILSKGGTGLVVIDANMASDTAEFCKSPKIPVIVLKAKDRTIPPAWREDLDPHKIYLKPFLTQEFYEILQRHG